GALVTPDRDLARRVKAALSRWNVVIDDSAGQPVADSPTGVFLRLVADAVAEDFAPVPLLSLLKHPFCAAGQDRLEFLGHVRALDRDILRGPRPAGGLGSIAALIKEQIENKAAPVTLGPWWDRLSPVLEPLTAPMHLGQAGLGDVIEAHLATAEALAATDTTPGAETLWREEAGEALAGFFEEWRAMADRAAPLPPRRYLALLEEMLAGQVVRPRYGTHPRLSILGPLEARLVQADVLVLGGLNEDSWPPEADADPWLSRPMRREIGLPLPERRTGLSAHDFVQGAAAPVVYLTRSEKSGGAPTRPSRWLLRLDALIGKENWPRPPVLAWHRELDAPKTAPERVKRPAPKPPVALRPRQLSVTQIETWRRNPFAIYADKILRLRPLDELDADPGGRDRGIIIHDILDQFLKEPVPADRAEAHAKLIRLGRQEFARYAHRPVI
ncbi:MAG: PD-(D/E)XK nuclease family protein, partial [Alphaproteobacteria bacterium]|nr:PD-(D/E)XK nuclease family protein [Alphaproteobacteria bacterium]